MSNTPNARKSAARQHQREHGGSYTAALAAVSPEGAAAAPQLNSNTTRDAAAEAIRAVRYFDEATAHVVGQGDALKKLRTLLVQHVAAGGAAGENVVVGIDAPERGLWEETICVAFAQAWVMGMTGVDVVPAPCEAEPKNGVTWVGDAAILEGIGHGLGRSGYRELLEKDGLCVWYNTGKMASGSAITLRYLSTPELGFVVLRRLVELVGETPAFTVEDIAKSVGNRKGTGDEARDLADKALARALVRSTIDSPGSSTGVIFEDVVEAFEFLKLGAFA